MTRIGGRQSSGQDRSRRVRASAPLPLPPGLGLLLAALFAIMPRAVGATVVEPSQDPPRQAGAAATRPVPPDAYADPGAGEQIERGRAERKARAAGLASFEATFRERIYTGLSGSFFRRERALFHRERAARVRWAAEGSNIVRWLGVRAGVPIAGLAIEFEDNPRSDDAFDFDFDFLDPEGDQITLGSGEALHPLADTAVYHYRYRSGDTLRIRLAGIERTVTLIEVIFEPREARFDRIAGSLWFDDAEGLVARAAYRPAITYDMETENPEDAAEVPGFVKPIRATVDFISVDFGLQQLRWWLPHRVAFDATATAGSIASMPVRLEWTFDDYVVNQRQTLDPGEDLPEGWTRWVESADDTISAAEGDRLAGEDTPGAVATADRAGRRRTRDDPLAAAGDSLPGDSRPIIMIVPPADSLLDSPELPEPLFSASVDAFAPEELGKLRERLAALDLPGGGPLGRRLSMGFGFGRMRYNRVEGLSLAHEVAWRTGVSSDIFATPRIGVPEFVPGAEAGWRVRAPRGQFSVTAYRRLADVQDWGRPLSFLGSFNSLFLGADEGLYFRETGMEIAFRRQNARTSFEASLFAERHEDAPKQLNVSLPGLIGSREFPANLAAATGNVAGVSGRLRAFTTVDPGKPVLSGALWGEAAGGDFGYYGRVALSANLQIPAGRWAVALEGGTGTVIGPAPVQRQFHLGGAYTLRAFDPGSASGDVFWLGRAEVGRGFRVGGSQYDVGGATYRVTAFGDAAWAAPRNAADGASDWRASAGVGFSFMDGLIRIDVARAIRGGSGILLHIYADGLM